MAIARAFNSHAVAAVPASLCILAASVHMVDKRDQSGRVEHAIAVFQASNFEKWRQESIPLFGPRFSISQRWNFERAQENCRRLYKKWARIWAHFSGQESGPFFGPKIGTIFRARNRDHFSGQESGPFFGPRIGTIFRAKIRDHFSGQDLGPKMGHLFGLFDF